VSSPHSDRDARLAAILRATADLASSRTAYGEALAARTGLAATDVEVLRLLAMEGAMTVGRIGELASLTTGATTRMVDRLEQAGFVRRTADPADRRRVNVELARERAEPVLRAYDPVDDAARAALEVLDDDTLGALHGYLLASVDAYRAEPAGVGGGGATADGTPLAEAGVTAPIASATAGRLVFVTGAPSVRIAGATDLGGDLYRARFSGAVPSARVRDGVVTIRYPRFAWFDWRTRIGDQWLNASAHWRRDSTDLALNASFPWSVELRGGATAMTADFRAIRLTSLTIAGGAGSVSIQLGQPAGVVRVRVKGGAGDVLVRRPTGVPAILSVEGGYRTATLDGTAAWSPGRMASDGAETAADRIEVGISGGANRVTVSAGS
jgi:DNA-binding MarR family transcriptional regulator